MKTTKRWTLENGMRVLYQRDAGFPLASATILFRVGSRQESAREAGLCSMTLDLLQQGTRRHNAREIARVMESVGASMGTQAHEDYSEMGFVVPASELARALEVATEVLREPSFPREEIAKEKAHVVASLRSRRDAIFNLAYDHLNKALFGDHPYARPLEGRKETVKSFRCDHFKEWHRQKIRPERAILSLIAPFPDQEVLKRLNKTIGQWQPNPGTQGKRMAIPAVRPLKGPQDIHLTSPFEQAYLMTGWQAPGMAHADQIPLKVLNTLMGGGMSSRLFVTLREKLGLAYEVSSFYPTRLDLSQWVIYLGLPAEKLKTASRSLNDMLESLCRRGPAPSELRQAQAMIRGAYLMDSQSRRRKAWYKAWWEFLGRGDQYGEEFIKAIDSVTPADILRVARHIVKSPRVTVTVAPK